MKKLQCSIIALALFLSCTGQAAAENVLRWASAGGALTWDPHGTTDAATSTWWQQVYETPFSLAPDLKFENRLFIRERIVDALTWEFELRQGVRFHDGTPLTAEDVIFSIERQRESSDQRHNVSIVATADAIAADRLRVQTATRDMLLPTQLRRVSVMSKAWAEQYGAAEPRSHRDAEQTYARWHANGTGPFVLERADESGSIRLARNPDWWGWREHSGNIDRIEFTLVADPQHRLEMLLAGEIDLLTDPPFDAIEQIRKTPGLKLVQELELRTIFLGFDHEIPELRSSDIKGRNPFRDKRVRQAVYQAIDVEAIRRDVMRGLTASGPGQAEGVGSNRGLATTLTCSSMRRGCDRPKSRSAPGSCATGAEGSVRS
jgi:peptide/nickel transport system substrate-binding protein